MTMQLRIVHTTRFTYDGEAVASYNQARLTPLTTQDQIVAHHRLEVAPKPWTYEYKDYFGNEVTAIEVIDPHESLRVTATSTVHVSRQPVPVPSLTWAQIHAPQVADRWVEYLRMPEPVTPPADLAAAAKALAADADLPGEAAASIAAYVASTIAAGEEPVGERDLAHLTIGTLRTAGIPARYVSGYAHPSPEPEIGETATGGDHPWVEWWDDGWRGVDPATGQAPGDTYVAVATGRDHCDVKSLSGIYSGAGSTTPEVSVEVTRIG